jgi:Concanavalin A-like lectin/glucanases superfamily
VSRGFVSASTQHISAASAPNLPFPFTLSCWFYPTASTTTVPFAIRNGASYYAGIFTIATSNHLRAQIDGGGGAAIAETTVGFTLNTWNHACAVFAGGNSRTIYLNGGNKVLNIAGALAQVMNATDVGYYGGGPSLYFDGKIAEAVIWSDALTDDEVLALARGMHHQRVHPGHVVLYWPLYGVSSPEPDLSTGGRTGTLTNTPLLADHAPIGPLWIPGLGDMSPAAVAVPSSVPAQAVILG